MTFFKVFHLTLIIFYFFTGRNFSLHDGFKGGTTDNRPLKNQPQHERITYPLEDMEP